MTISAVLSSTIAALDAAKIDLARVNARVEELEAERRSVSMTPPHTDDIVAVFRRGLADATGAFRRQLAGHLTATFTGDKAADAATRAMQLMTIEPQVPSSEDRMTRQMRGQPADLNVAAVIYFMRDKIEAEIPVLVDSLFPTGKQGMKQTERAALLQKLDQEIAEHRAKAEQLAGDIAAVRAAVRQ